MQMGVVVGELGGEGCLSGRIGVLRCLMMRVFICNWIVITVRAEQTNCKTQGPDQLRRYLCILCVASMHYLFPSSIIS